LLGRAVEESISVPLGRMEALLERLIGFDRLAKAA
jgi:hypothetical protein